jgi:predicted DNA-binding transcriptional regulator AlpA
VVADTLPEGVVMLQEALEQVLSRMSQPSLFVRAKDLPRLLGVSATRCYELREHSQFPRPKSLGNDKDPLWLRSEVIAWAEKLPPRSKR